MLFLVGLLAVVVGLENGDLTWFVVGVLCIAADALTSK